MRTLTLTAALILSATSALAQPKILHANVGTVPAAGDLGAQIRGARSAWAGYSVPAVDNDRVMCCFENWGNFRSGGTCHLSDDSSSFSNVDRDDIRPAAGSFAVFYRVENGAIGRIRTFSLDCALDAGNASVTWLTGVDPRQSVALLASLVGDDRSVSKRALSALALHGEASAGERLEQFARSTVASTETRGDAVFWLAETRPERGFEVARSIVRDGSLPSKLREKAIFALSLIKTPAATDEMIRVAKSDTDSHTRGQAIFWLSQQAGRKAAAAIRDAVDADADEHVREKAVFAVSQLPDDQSVPLLIDLMNNHRDSRVRKKAAFWLGQKKDPRAIEAIEKLLMR